MIFPFDGTILSQEAMRLISRGFADPRKVVAGEIRVADAIPKRAMTEDVHAYFVEMMQIMVGQRKAWRQWFFVVQSVVEFVSRELDIPILDDGDVEGFVRSLKAAIVKVSREHRD